jgi:hypothetical protein
MSRRKIDQFKGFCKEGMLTDMFRIAESIDREFRFSLQNPAKISKDLYIDYGRWIAYNEVFNMIKEGSVGKGKW